MDFIPEVKMDYIPKEEEVNDETKEENSNFVYDDDETKEEPEEETKEEEVMPKVVKPNKAIDPNEIFSLNDEDRKHINKNIKLTKKGVPYKKRPPLSEEHKLKLAKAREKAYIARKAKAKVRKEDKELDKKSKELLRVKKQKDVEKLEKEVISGIKPTSTTTSIDIEKAVLDGIAKYETLRKARKKEKEAVQKKEKEENEVREKLKREIAKPKIYNPYASCY